MNRLGGDAAVNYLGRGEKETHATDEENNHDDEVASHRAYDVVENHVPHDEARHVLPEMVLVILAAHVCEAHPESGEAEIRGDGYLLAGYQHVGVEVYQGWLHDDAAESRRAQNGVLAESCLARIVEVANHLCDAGVNHHGGAVVASL